MSSPIVQPTLGVVATDSVTYTKNGVGHATAYKGTIGFLHGDVQSAFDPTYSYMYAETAGSTINSGSDPALALTASASSAASATTFFDDLHFGATVQTFRINNQYSVASTAAIAQISDIFTVSGIITQPETIRLFLTGFGTISSTSAPANSVSLPAPTDQTNDFAYIDIAAQSSVDSPVDVAVLLSKLTDTGVTYSTSIGNAGHGGSILDSGIGPVYKFTAYVDVTVTDQYRTIKILEQGVDNPGMSGYGTLSESFNASLSVGAPAGLTVTNAHGYQLSQFSQLALATTARPPPP